MRCQQIPRPFPEHFRHFFQGIRLWNKKKTKKTTKWVDSEFPGIFPGLSQDFSRTFSRENLGQRQSHAMVILPWQNCHQNPRTLPWRLAMAFLLSNFAIAPNAAHGAMGKCHGRLAMADSPCPACVQHLTPTYLSFLLSIRRVRDARLVGDRFHSRVLDLDGFRTYCLRAKPRIILH